MKTSTLLLVLAGCGVLLGLAAGLLVFSVFPGLPSNAEIVLGFKGLWVALAKMERWTVSLTTGVSVIAVTLTIIFVTYAILRVLAVAAREVWDKCAAAVISGRALIRQRLDQAAIVIARSTGQAGLEQSIASILGLVVAVLAGAALVAIVSGFSRSGVAITGFIAALLALVGVVVLFLVHRELQQDPAAFRSRSPAFGGGRSEWSISKGLLWTFMALIFLGGAVALGGAAMRVELASAERNNAASPPQAGGDKGAPPGAVNPKDGK